MTNPASRTDPLPPVWVAAEHDPVDIVEALAGMPLSVLRVANPLDVGAQTGARAHVFVAVGDATDPLAMRTIRSVRNTAGFEEAAALVVASEGTPRAIAAGSLREGADDFVTRPIDRDELRARVERLRERAGDEAPRVRAHLHSFVSQLPVAVSVLRGRELIVEFVNERYETMVGRPVPRGAPFRDAFPELASDAPVFRMIETVLETGVPFSTRSTSPADTNTGRSSSHRCARHAACSSSRIARRR